MYLVLFSRWLCFPKTRAMLSEGCPFRTSDVIYQAQTGVVSEVTSRSVTLCTTTACCHTKKPPAELSIQRTGARQVPAPRWVPSPRRAGCCVRLSGFHPLQTP